jgi:hypothetical protein
LDGGITSLDGVFEAVSGLSKASSECIVTGAEISDEALAGRIIFAFPYVWYGTNRSYQAILDLMSAAQHDKLELDLQDITVLYSKPE